MPRRLALVGVCPDGLRAIEAWNDGEIVEIAQTVPEPFRERCFDVLLNALLNESNAKPPQRITPPDPNTLAAVPEPPTPPAAGMTTGELPLKGQMHLFMKRTGISEETLSKVVSYVDGEIHFIHDPKPANLAAGQIEWSLLSALKNAIENNVFSLDGDQIKQICDEKGFLDAKNFWAIFRRNDKLFAKALTSADPRQVLSGDGQAELAKLIESLAVR